MQKDHATMNIKQNEPKRHPKNVMHDTYGLFQRQSNVGFILELHLISDVHHQNIKLNVEMLKVTMVPHRLCSPEHCTFLPRRAGGRYKYVHILKGGILII